MVRILLNGANGKMGQEIALMAEGSDECEITAGVDKFTEKKNSFPVYKELSECRESFDVIVDFSNASGIDALLEYAVKEKKPVVLATTGATEEQKEKIKKASEETAVFYSANMSLGINLLIDLVKKAAGVLGDDYDIEIIEKHHNQKLDAPSGTALLIADSISKVTPSPMEYVYDRHSVRKKRDKKEIGISSVRGGTIVGEHEVIFAGPDEIIEIKHHASSRRVFAQGALRAAVFLCGKEKGMYSMKDLIK